MDNHELYHYGIKGQRWGVRRFQKKNGSLTPAGKKRKKETWSEDATEASKIRKKPVKEMSNAELKRLNERIRLEQEYSRLNPSNSKKALAAVTATATAMGALLNLYNNSDKIVAKGKPIVDKLIKPAAEKARKEMAIGMWSDIHSDELYHYGVKGQKWGVRRYQNNDGTLTAEGKARYGNDITQRKVKDVRKQFQRGIASKTIDVGPISKKIYKEMDKTKESKDLDEFSRKIISAHNKAADAGIELAFGDDIVKRFTQLQDAYDKKFMEIGTKYADELAGVELTALGYENTKTAREWLIQQNFMDW